MELKYNSVQFMHSKSIASLFANQSESEYWS